LFFEIGGEQVERRGIYIARKELSRIPLNESEVKPYDGRSHWRPIESKLGWVDLPVGESYLGRLPSRRSRDRACSSKPVEHRVLQGS